MVLLISYLVAAFACAFLAGIIADLRGLTGCLFFMAAFFVGPFAVLAALIMPRDKTEDTKDALKRGSLIECPHCFQPVRREATVCPFCRSVLVPKLPLRTWSSGIWNFFNKTYKWNDD